MKITFKCLTDGYFDHVLPDEVRVARFRGTKGTDPFWKMEDEGSGMILGKGRRKKN